MRHKPRSFGPEPRDLLGRRLGAQDQVGGDDLEIIPVATLEDAIEVLEELGGDPIPPPPE